MLYSENMNPVITISDLADHFDSCIDDGKLYLNTKTGDVYYRYEFYEDQSDNIDLTSPDIVELPAKYEFNEYHVIENFSTTYPNPHVAEQLSSLIEGKGAFRRFKEAIYRFDIEEEWYDFRFHALQQMLIEWCDKNLLSYIPPAPNVETMDAETHSITINLPADDVYKYLSDVCNWHFWTPFVQHAEFKEFYWLIHSPWGDFELTPQFNRGLQLLDFSISCEDIGLSLFVPFRIVPNLEGSQIMITLFSPPQLQQDQYNQFCLWMGKGLTTLKGILER